MTEVLKIQVRKKMLAKDTKFESCKEESEGNLLVETGAYSEIF